MFEILGYKFFGPFTYFIETPAVYIVISNMSGRIIDVGETNNLKQRMSNHERKIQWTRQTNLLGYKIYYTPIISISIRLMVERLIRMIYNPSCGEK